MRYTENAADLLKLIYVDVYGFSLEILSFVWFLISVIRYFKAPKEKSGLKEDIKNKMLISFVSFVFLIFLSVFYEFPVSLIAMPVMTLVVFLVFFYNTVTLLICPKEERKKHIGHTAFCGKLFLVMLGTVLLFVYAAATLPYNG